MMAALDDNVLSVLIISLLVNHEKLSLYLYLICRRVID